MNVDLARRAIRARRRFAVGMALLATVAGEAGAQMPGMPDMPEMKEGMRWGRALFVLFDQFEYAPAGEGRPANVEALAWYGGAYNRLWVRTQGEVATTERAGEAEAEVLFGRLVDPYWDAVIGVRVDKHWGDEDPERAQLAVGFIGLAPYRFEFQPTLFVSPRGEVSARIEVGYQFMLTQRLVAEPELELNAAVQASRRYDIARGLNDYETGLRVRYEFRREIAPYVGVSRSRRVGGATNISRAHGEPIADTRFVMGVRLWR